MGPPGTIKPETNIALSLSVTTNHVIPYRPQKLQEVYHKNIPLSVQLTRYRPRLSLDPSKPKLSPEEKSTLEANIQLLRDAIVLFTATGAARGVSGHTGESAG